MSKTVFRISILILLVSSFIVLVISLFNQGNVPMNNDPYDLFKTGHDYYKKENYQAALEAFKKVIELKPDSAEAHLSVGSILSRMGKNEEALDAYKASLKYNPKYAEAHYGLGLTYGHLGDYAQSIKAFKKSLEINPYYEEAYFGLGHALYDTRQFSEAAEALQKGLQIKPDDSDAIYGLGIAYVMLNDKDSAFEQYNILRKLDNELAYKLLDAITNYEVTSDKSLKGNAK